MVETNPAVERDKTAWNIASDQARIISSLLQKAVSHYLKGELDKWYFSIQTIREMINYGLNESERKDFDEKENNVVKLRPAPDKEGKINPNQRHNYGRSIVMYQRDVMDTLNNLGFFPSKEDRTHMKF
jgi:hypothetical protein